MSNTAIFKRTNFGTEFVRTVSDAEASGANGTVVTKSGATFIFARVLPSMPRGTFDEWDEIYNKAGYNG